jgi:hypothetical protein
MQSSTWSPFRRPGFILLIWLGALLGCGTTPTSTTTASSSLNLAGDWAVLVPVNTLVPITLPTPVADFLGALQSSAGTVTGTFHALSPSLTPCVPYTQDLPVSGTIDPSNKLTLTIPIAGGTATITAAITTPESYTNGTWQIVGGSCAMPLTAIQMAEFAPVTGTYTGVFNVIDTTTGLPVSGTATNVTTALVQATTPNADGQFLLSGTITTSGACTINSPINDEFVSGGVIQPFVYANPGVILTGGIIPTGTTLAGGFSSLSACGSQLYFGTLAIQ